MDNVYKFTFSNKKKLWEFSLVTDKRILDGKMSSVRRYCLSDEGLFTEDKTRFYCNMDKFDVGDRIDGMKLRGVYIPLSLIKSIKRNLEIDKIL